ncbi:MAG: ABC transporter permease [Gallionellaceae bacterium]
MKHDLSLPHISLRFFPIWQRHFLVWKKLAVTSILGSLADPLIYMLGLGYGLGSLLPEMGGMTYLMYVSGGTLCYSSMNSATFEALYSGFSRMHVQRTWDAILNTPITLDDIVLSEMLWAATKSLLSGIAVLFVIWMLGMGHNWLSLWTIPITLLAGLCFAALGLIITALAPSYDFFMYYFTLLITPMMMLSGVFFPVDQLPQVLQNISMVLPLTHTIELVRPLLNDAVPSNILLHLAVILAYTLVAFYVSLILFRRRLSK